MSNPLIQIGSDVREMTAAEFTEWQNHNAEIEAQQNAISAENAAIEAARVSAKNKLATLGLTDDEITALLGAI